MQNNRTGSYARHNSINGAKRQLLGHPGGNPSPAWRPHNIPNGHPVHQLPGQPASVFKGKNVSSVEQGSKIFLSRLPVDVGEKEVEELFKKTVGPVKESFLLYNSQGRSKGMAIVQFQRASDATAARAKYNGKIVDGRTPIKIEIIYDGAPVTVAPNASPAPQPSLLSRLGLQKPPTPSPRAGHTKAAQQAAGAPVYFPPASAAVPIDPPRRQRLKKGAKRVNKGVAAVSAAIAVANLRSRAKLNVKDLDAEMDAYRAEANGMSF
ncbi:hypothetical protein BDQ17DRAFT_1234813 [Cyathus striatus]|nr:hypothetical protein BDQ17DRAFT_1234813 [Cyathus striatus]